MRKLTFQCGAFARLRLTQKQDVDLCLGLFLLISLLTNHLVDVVADLLGIDLCFKALVSLNGRLICGR